MDRRGRRFGALGGLLGLALGALAAASAHAQPAPPPGYLAGAPLGYAVPPAPTDPELLRMDLARVRSSQASPTSVTWQEAESDARAYFANDIIRRFEDASVMPLSPLERPILVHVLQRVIKDTGDYAAAGKAANPRNRPYVGHADIVPCNTAYLKPNESYPSGHAMNGYTVGALLADLFPGRDQALVARGVRYGDNRVVCGVHNPTDVDQGRMLAIAYLKALRADHGFQVEFDCAREEDAVIAKTKPSLSPACLALAPPPTLLGLKAAKQVQAPAAKLF